MKSKKQKTQHYPPVGHTLPKCLYGCNIKNKKYDLDGDVYVCCDHRRVRKIDKNDFTVSDVRKTYTDLMGYYRFGKYAIIIKHDGAYCDKD